MVFRGHAINKGPKTPKIDGPRQVQDGSSHAQDGPRQAQNSPRQVQDKAKIAQDRPKMAKDRPKIGQDRPKTVQDRSKTCSRWLQERPGIVSRGAERGASRSQGIQVGPKQLGAAQSSLF